MRRQLLSLAFGLTILAPSVGISCDDDGDKQANAAPAAQVTSEQKDADRKPTSKDQEQQSDETDQNSARRELFNRYPFSKL